MGSTRTKHIQRYLTEAFAKDHYCSPPSSLETHYFTVWTCDNEEYPNCARTWVLHPFESAWTNNRPKIYIEGAVGLLGVWVELMPYE